jgi:hypothetical protein
MANDQYQHTVDGAEVEEEDFNLLGQLTGLLDDYVLAELLRLAPYDGTTYARGVLPYGVAGRNGAMVQPNGSSGSVLVMPFRVIVGPRTAVSAVSAGTSDDSARAAWRDIRSAVYAPSSDGATLGKKLTFANGDPTNPRWDLVYAQITVDTPGPGKPRSVRPPGSTTATTQSVRTTKRSPVTLNVVTGAAAATPSVPALPADTPGSGIFNVPIAAIRIPASFGSTSLVSAQQIQMLAPAISIAEAAGASSSAPASGLSSAYPSAGVGTWGASGSRPVLALPCTARGGRTVWFGLDATTGSPVIADAGVVDASIDWRNRIVLVTVKGSAAATQFAFQHGATSGGGANVLMPEAAAGTVLQDVAQTLVDDSSAAATFGTARGPVVCILKNASFAPVAGGAAVGLYVDASTGALKLFYQGTPGCRLFFVVQALGAIDNP